MRLARRMATPSHSYFNPRIPYGMRPAKYEKLTILGIFQSTHPVWDATYAASVHSAAVKISIHASRMGCDLGDLRRRRHRAISIHASRMGCDVTIFRAFSSSVNFNPRIPYGMRLTRALDSQRAVRFQSTHPVWDATTGSDEAGQRYGISIHASRMGCDLTKRGWTRLPAFQSTHPVWDATVWALSAEPHICISIHASRMGCDAWKKIHALGCL